MLSPTRLELSGERFSAVYSFTGDYDEAYRKAKDVCVEQTVEFPEDLIPDDDIKKLIIGKIESFDKTEKGYQAEISFAIEITANELTQFLNVIFGNISLKPGIRLEKINLSQGLYTFLQGPRFGIAGLRQYLGVYDRPLLCTAIKPMGLSNKELANLAYQFAKGGIDIIKDDHGISNQAFSEYQDRVIRCVEAIHRANEESGNHAIYAPCITAMDEQLKERAHYAKEVGAGGLLVSPGIVGFDRMQSLANDDTLALPILYHPTFLGSFVTNPHAGISPYVLFGQLARLSGADVVIFPNYGGRFSFSKEDCLEILRGSTEPMDKIKPIFPAPAGGMKLQAIHEMVNTYGRDVVLLIGGDLHRHGSDLVQNSKLFRQYVCL